MKSPLLMLVCAIKEWAYLLYWLFFLKFLSILFGRRNLISAYLYIFNCNLPSLLVKCYSTSLQSCVYLISYGHDHFFLILLLFHYFLLATFQAFAPVMLSFYYQLITHVSMQDFAMQHFLDSLQAKHLLRIQFWCIHFLDIIVPIKFFRLHEYFSIL